jgi:transposase-like protein
MARPPRFKSKRTLAPQSAPGIYASTYTPEVGAAICRRVAAGESLRSICRADPSMPTGKTVWNWARAHEEFRLMKAHALSVARAASLAAQGRRDAARRAAVGTRTRKAWNAGLDGYDADIDWAICERLVMGETLTAICRRWDMPSIGTVYHWLRRYPEFLEHYRCAKAAAPEAMLELACEGLPWIGERKSWPMLRRVVRETDRASARLSLKRYAPAEGPRELTVRVEQPDGSVEVIYGGPRTADGGSG